MPTTAADNLNICDLRVLYNLFCNFVFTVLDMSSHCQLGGDKTAVGTGDLNFAIVTSSISGNFPSLRCCLRYDFRTYVLMIFTGRAKVEVGRIDTHLVSVGVIKTQMAAMGLTPLGFRNVKKLSQVLSGLNRLLVTIFVFRKLTGSAEVDVGLSFFNRLVSVVLHIPIVASTLGLFTPCTLPFCGNIGQPLTTNIDKCKCHPLFSVYLIPQ